ncbi:MAG: metalloregulator ArsR/SmtB family transcription factor [Chthonomonadales bacterium]
MPNDEIIELCETTLVDADAVAALKPTLSSRDELQSLADLFNALSDSTRLRIIEALSRRELCVCDLSAVLEMSQSAISHQLRLLRQLRLVRHRRSGRLVYYSLDDQHIHGLFAIGYEHIREESLRTSQSSSRYLNSEDAA